MKWKIWVTAAIGIGILASWVTADLADSSRHDLRSFDAHEVARLETAMWRAYYEHHQARLFAELTQLLQEEFHLSFWKACAGGFHAARAAVVFQAGKSREDYRQALPEIRRYYSLVRGASPTDFDVERVSRLELEWWIIHRERAQHAPEDLYSWLAELQSAIYGMPVERFAEHARARGDAMLLRDDRAGAISERDWQRIGAMLDRSWTSLHGAVAPVTGP